MLKESSTKLLETLPAFNINNLLNNISNDVIKDKGVRLRLCIIIQKIIIKINTEFFFFFHYMNLWIAKVITLRIKISIFIKTHIL